jgi:hypothetical protein
MALWLSKPLSACRATTILTEEADIEVAIALITPGHDPSTKCFGL